MVKLLGRSPRICGCGGSGRFYLCAAVRAAPGNHASQNESLECVLVRSDNEAVVVNLDIEPIEKPEQVAWIDPIHKG
jgi:uncharacterized RmlC-like cupin family protein